VSSCSDNDKEALKGDGGKRAQPINFQSGGIRQSTSQTKRSSTPDPLVVAANSRDESSHVSPNQCQGEPTGPVDAVLEQATSKSSPPTLPWSDVELERSCDQLVVPEYAALQAHAEQNVCYSLSKSFKIQLLQLKLGFIGAVTIDPHA
jgi:hypothetical protein